MAGTGEWLRVDFEPADLEEVGIDGARGRLESAGFEVSVGPDVDSKCPAGTVAGTNPSGRTIKGGVVIIEKSNGKGAEQPETPQLPGTPPTKPTKPGRR